MAQIRKRKIFTKRRGVFSVLLALVFGLSTALGQTANKVSAPEEKPLAANERVERKIRAGETHFFTFNLKRGELAHITVEQRGVNITLAIGNNAERKVIRETDAAKTAGGVEDFVFMAEADGKYIFGVFAFAPDSDGSNYVLQNGAPFSTKEEKDAAARYLAEQGDKVSAKKDYALAALYHENILKLPYGLPASPALGLTLFALAGDFYSLAEYKKAIDYYLKAAPVFALVKDKSNQAYSLLNTGTAFSFLKNYGKAQNYFQQSLLIFRQTPDKAGEADNLTRLGDNISALRQYEKSLDYYRQALPIVQNLKDKLAEGRLFTRIGAVYSTLEKPNPAIANFQKARAIFRQLKNPIEEGYAINGLAYSQFQLNNNPEALVLYEQALKISHEENDRVLEINTLSGIGNSRLMLGLYDDALKAHNEALKIARDQKREEEEAAALASIGIVYAERGNYDLAIDFYLQSLAIDEKINNREDKSNNLGNLGEIYMRLGNLKKAEEVILEALRIRAEFPQRNGDSFTLANLGTIYTRLKKPVKAVVYFEKSLSMLKNQKADFQVIYAKIYYGMLRRQLGETLQAAKLHTEAAELAKAVKIPKYESFADYELGLDYLAQNKPEIAVANFERALTLARTVNARDQAAASLDGLMQAWNRRGEKRLAVFYGKQSINLLQETRNEIVKLDKETQTNFTKDSEPVYRLLADILIGEGRLPEAQKVLAMLKQEEFAQFVQRSPEEISELSKRIELNETEHKAFEEYARLSDNLTAKGARFQTLQKKTDRTSEEDAQFQTLAAELQQTNAAFEAFLRSVAGEFKQSASTNIDLSEIKSLQSDLRKAGNDVVLVSTFVLPERYRVIVTTGRTQIDRKYDIKSEELNKKINAFRDILSNPCACQDPRPLGRELYNILVKPIQSDLDKAGAKTVLWSLDGALRLIPIHAIFDGDKYLAERYENVLVTLGRNSRLFSETNQKWRALGLGVSEKKGNFNALPAVEKELASIVRDEANKNETQGVLSGRRLLNPEFTAKNFQKELGLDFNIIHIATHFNLNENSRNSFLLLGDGTELTMAEFSNSPLYPMEDVELLTLSACETGVGAGGGGNGKEFESFGMIAEKNGAKAVMATLWKVADCSTGEFMSEFYRTHQTQTAVTKAAALQTVQKAMISGAITESTDCKVRSEIVYAGKKQTAPPFVKDAQKPFAHPYYWSPFILIGNWR